MNESRHPNGWMVGTVALLVMIGVAAAIGRSMFPADLAIRADPVRERLMNALHRDDPFARVRPEEVRQFDSRFATHPRMTLWHILPGGIFLLLAPFQFSRRIRTRHIQVHRWSGRILMLLAVVAALTGLYYGVLIPYAGIGEASAVALFGVLLLVSVGRAYVAIRRGDVGRHREWVIRAFAIMISISTVRVASVVLDLGLTPSGFRLKEIFVFSLWTGWLLTVGVAEVWIRSTRVRGAFRAAAP